MRAKLTVHHLWFTVEAQTPLALPTESGPAIRGALVSALRRHYCPDATLRPTDRRIEADPGHRTLCPACWLIATEDASGERGRNIQRPYTIEPPLRLPPRLEPGASFSFGVSLIGQAVNLFPYLVLAVPEMGRLGLGHVDPRQGGRGRFVLRAVSAIDPLTGASQPLLTEGARLHLPTLPVETARVDEVAHRLAERARANDRRLTLRFLTPTRLIAESHLVRRPTFEPLFQRLLERVDGLTRYYASQTNDEEPGLREELVRLARRVEVVEDRTEWVELMSGSRRLGRATPASGFRGAATYRSEDWPRLLPWLLWGQSLHVGKSAVKGDGWYVVDGCPGWAVETGGEGSGAGG